MQPDLVAVVEPGGEPLGRGTQVDVRGDEAGVDEVIGFLHVWIVQSRLLEALGMGEAMEVGDDLYDAKITVLGEQIKHHVEEEEEELFPEVESSDLDVSEVGGRMAARKKELMANMGMAPAR